MYEIWLRDGRTRKVIARFRLLKDAETYLEQHKALGPLEIGVAGDTGQPPPSRITPNQTKPRRKSGVKAKAVIMGAVEHPDEFIADQGKSEIG